MDFFSKDDGGVEDHEFLSLVDAVENDALKRRKIMKSPTSVQSSSSSNSMEEGKYTAALRGSKSHLWQQAHSSSGPNMSTNMNTHNKKEHVGGGGGIPFSLDENVPEKQCPCGGGPCIVLTSNTEKNPGRKFYKCPVREESGRCGFFEWCDAAQSPLGSSGVQNNNFNADISTGSEPSMQCPCGAGPCSVLTAKTEKNRGRQFFKCPLKQVDGPCTFFKWCDELNSASHTSSVPAQNFSARYDSTRSSSGRSGPSPCYKCGMDGHWAKDCPKSSLSTVGSPSTVQGDRSTCYKCGQAGHWAKDCSYQASGSGYNRAQTNASYNPGGYGRQGPWMHKSK